MRLAVRLLYNVLLPVGCLLAAPAWIVRMARRGGLGPHLWERLGCYDRPAEFEPIRGIYVHAVSVGEVVIALKLIRQWLERDGDERFVLAATTSTGFQLAREEAPPGVRVIYSPVDFPFLVARLFRRFEPRLLVLVESELWPNLLRGAGRRQVPVALANARLSPRSARRYRKFKALAAAMLGELDLVCAQAESHAGTWREIGVPAGKVTVTGSVKFDLEGSAPPARRPEFEEMLEAFGAGRPVVLAGSTHAGEEALIAKAVRESAGALPVVLPRHAERRHEVAADLTRAGFEVVLRSRFAPPQDRASAVFVIDSTGELRDWIAHADLVVIGKSLLARGGQNPAEAIAAKVAVVCGVHMENFEPLIGQLRAVEAVRRVADPADLPAAIADLLADARERARMIRAATAVLHDHHGATARTVALLARMAAG